MGVYRRWRRPADGAIHLIGDTHYGSVFMNANRKQAWADDLVNATGMLPDSVLHLVVGDMVHNGLPDEDEEAVSHLDELFGAGTWITAVGNHDLYGGRSVPDDAAQAWGMPGANYVHDLGYVRIIVVCSDDGLQGDLTSMVPFSSSRLEWINAQLVAAGDTPCLITCHWSLYDTVQPGTEGFDSSLTEGFWAENDTEILALLADNANAKAWLSGHTHSPLHVPGIVTPVRVGGHTLAAVNASSPAYTGTGEAGKSELATMYLTVTDGRIETRFRNHGSGTWYVAGPDRYDRWAVNV